MYNRIKKFNEMYSDSSYRCPNCGSDETISKSEFEEQQRKKKKEGLTWDVWDCDYWYIKCADCGECYQTPDI